LWAAKDFNHKENFIKNLRQRLKSIIDQLKLLISRPHSHSSLLSHYYPFLTQFQLFYSVQAFSVAVFEVKLPHFA
jgi:hypothetical protein